MLFSDAEDNTSGPLNTGGLAGLPLLRLGISNSPKVPRTNFLRSDGLFRFSSICNFGSFKNPFATINGLSELYFRFRRFILLIQMREVISINYGSSKGCWKPWRWVRFDLILTMRNVYINSNLNPLTEFTSSSRSTEFKDLFPWNISQMITKTIPISTRIVISDTMKRGILFWVYWKVSGTTTWSEFPNGGKAVVEQIIASEQINKSKRAELWESQLGIRVGKLII